ncbi:MAG: AbgT family transporter, partial [Prevotellaceae bacterium]|nr:AbgT family transporter [Prevotellaceae bacterium]
MNKFLHTLPFLLLILIALLTILSWIGNVYGMDVQNLLSADGIRWAVGNILPNFNAAPIVATLISMMTLSIVIESDLLPVIASCFTHRRRSRRTLKQRRAFQYAAIVFVAGILLILALTLPVGSVLLSAFGTFEGSPLQDGLYPLLLLLLFLSATT